MRRTGCRPRARARSRSRFARTMHASRDAARAARSRRERCSTATAERAFLAALEGGCQVPIGALLIGEGPERSAARLRRRLQRQAHDSRIARDRQRSPRAPPAKRSPRRCDSEGATEILASMREAARKFRRRSRNRPCTSHLTRVNQFRAMPSFPEYRPRRLRRTEALRRLVRETGSHRRSSCCRCSFARAREIRKPVELDARRRPDSPSTRCCATLDEAADARRRRRAALRHSRPQGRDRLRSVERRRLRCSKRCARSSASCRSSS